MNQPTENTLPIVIKYGGSLLEDEAHQAEFLSQVAQLPQHYRSVILVHGGGKEITRALEAEGIRTRFVDGRRYTDEATMTVVDRVLAKINARIVFILRKNGAKAKGYSGQWNKLMLARQISELGRVGEPQTVHAQALQQVLSEAALPVFYTVALGADEKPLNMNADDFAMAIAIACKAQRLIYVTDTGAILDKSGKSIEVLNEARVKALIEDGTITGGMAVKANACLEAVRKGVGRVDICKSIEGLAAEPKATLDGTGFVS